jgi:hypothetical protein
MLVEGFALEGITQLAVDSIFMMPHLGVLASVHPEAAREIFEHDCLIHLGVSVCPRYNERKLRSDILAEVYLDGTRLGEVERGKVSQLTTVSGGKGLLKVVPVSPSVDVGSGPGVPRAREVLLGESGIICDGRNRPIAIREPTVTAQRLVFEGVGLVLPGGAQ